MEAKIGRVKSHPMRGPGDRSSFFIDFLTTLTVSEGSMNGMHGLDRDRGSVFTLIVESVILSSLKTGDFFR